MVPVEQKTGNQICGRCGGSGREPGGIQTQQQHERERKCTQCGGKGAK